MLQAHTIRNTQHAMHLNVKVIYLAAIHVALALTIIYIAQFPVGIGNAQALQIAKAYALDKCLATEYDPNDCKNLVIHQTASRYATSDGQVHDGYYLEANTNAFHASIALDSRGVLVSPTPKPIGD